MDINTLEHTCVFDDCISPKLCCGQILEKSTLQREGCYILTLKLRIDAGGLPPDHSLRLIPVLKAAGSHLELHCILINGRLRHRTYRGLFGLLGFFSKKKVSDSYQIYRAIRSGDDLQLDYRVSVPYQRWMDNSSILLRED